MIATDFSIADARDEQSRGSTSPRYSACVNAASSFSPICDAIPEYGKELTRSFQDYLI